MPQTLTFTVVNAQRVRIEQQIEIDGEAATAAFTRAVIEAAPDDRAGKTLTAVLPPDALDEFAEGAKLTVTIAALTAEPEA